MLDHHQYKQTFKALPQTSWEDISFNQFETKFERLETDRRAQAHRLTAMFVELHHKHADTEIEAPHRRKPKYITYSKHVYSAADFVSC